MGLRFVRGVWCDEAAKKNKGQIKNKESYRCVKCKIPSIFWKEVVYFQVKKLKFMKNSFTLNAKTSFIVMLA